MDDILEADWKKFSKLEPTALDRFYRRVIDEITAISNDTSKSDYQRYAAVHQLMKEKDQTLGLIFSQFKRSRALFQLGLMRRHELITDEEFATFSADTQDYVKRFLEGLAVVPVAER